MTKEHAITILRIINNNVPDDYELTDEEANAIAALSLKYL